MVVQAPEFQPARLQAYVENVPAARNYLLEALMPDQNVNDINFSWNVINGAYAPAASITGFNAAAPLRDKQAQSKAFGSVAKLQHSYFFDEVELFAYNKPRTPEERAQIVDQGLNYTDELVNGVRDTKEFLRAQAIYNGRVEYHNAKDDIHLEIDFPVPAGNQMTAATGWDDPAANPLADLQAMVKQYQATNQRRRPTGMHMTSATEALLLNNAQIRAQRFGTNAGTQLLTPDDLAAVFTALRLPAYQIQDDVININGADVQLLEDDKVVMFGAGLGFTAVGPAAERNFTPGIFAITQAKVNPPSEEIIVGQTAFPAFQRPSSVVSLSV